MGIVGKSYACEGMYRFIRSHGWSGCFAIQIIWRNGDIFVGVGVGIIDNLPKDEYENSSSMPFVGHSLMHSVCEVLCVIEKYFVVGKYFLYVCSGFGGNKFDFLYGNNCGGSLGASD